MSKDVDSYLAVHEVLVQIQRDEPHHRNIGARDKQSRQIPLDEICPGCPSRKKCWKVSLTLGDLGSERITPDEAREIVRKTLR